MSRTTVTPGVLPFLEGVLGQAACACRVQSPNAGGGCHSEAVAHGGSPSPVLLPRGLLSWSAPQQTRDVIFLASFQFLLSDVAEGFLDHATLLQETLHGPPIGLKSKSKLS